MVSSCLTYGERFSACAYILFWPEQPGPLCESDDWLFAGPLVAASSESVGSSHPLLDISPSLLRRVAGMLRFQ